MAQTADSIDATVTQSDNLEDSPMMAHLIESLRAGKDIGHYGRLTFTMVARYFMEDEELVELLAREPDFGAEKARALVAEVKAHGYNPPKRERILAWQAEQEFPICPDAEDPNGCDVYRELRFPDEVYDAIRQFWEERAEATS
ncbi:MAG TPA: hypothetical protein VKX16_01920 [Chloroflexota bacterium]|nr:hypothetical protein [Chloroflexota bacterium]